MRKMVVDGSQLPPAKPVACIPEPLKAVENLGPPKGGYSNKFS
jgi:hypothetical protein